MRKENPLNFFGHQYRSFDVYKDDIEIIRIAANHMNISEYWLTQDEIKDYYNDLNERRIKFSNLKKKKLNLYRMRIIGIYVFPLFIILLLLPRDTILSYLWLLILVFGLLAYPFYDITQNLEAIIEKKYSWYICKDTRIKKMVDDYKWKLASDSYLSMKNGIE